MLGSQDSNSWLKQQRNDSTQDSKSKLKTQTQDSAQDSNSWLKNEYFRSSSIKPKRGKNKAWLVSHDMLRTCPMHEGIPLELNPVLKLLEMRKGCWRGICTTCLVSIWNEQMNRWDPFFNHDDDNNDHAQIHSRRIESCAQAAGNAQGPPGIREYAQLVWSLSLSSAQWLSWTTGYVGEAMESHVHEVSLCRQGGGNSSATAIPTTTTCSWPLNAAHYHLPYLVSVYQLLLFKKLCSVRFFLQKEITKTKKMNVPANTCTLCNWALRIKCTSIFLYVFFTEKNLAYKN